MIVSITYNGRWRGARGCKLRKTRISTIFYNRPPTSDVPITILSYRHVRPTIHPFWLVFLNNFLIENIGAAAVGFYLTSNSPIGVYLQVPI